MSEMQVNHNLMLILLSKLTGRESDEEIYDKTRFAWKTKLERAKTVDYVIAHNSAEKVVGVFKPTEWLRADDPHFESLEKGLHPDRIGFIGVEAEVEVKEAYLAQNTPPRKRGAANPIRYLSLIKNKADNKSEDNTEDVDKTRIGYRAYLAGVGIEGTEPEDIASGCYDFSDASYYKFSQTSSIYLLGLEKEPEDKFTLEPENFKLVKIFAGTYSDDDPEPSRVQIEQILEQNSNLTFVDEEYMRLWFLFDYPDEDEDALEDPGDNWRYDFQEMANLLEMFTLVGYNSEVQDVIYQEWFEGDYDEGALSNPDSLDHYSGQNVETEHFVGLETFNLLKKD